MILKSKPLMIVVAIGYGVLLSLALTGGVLIACLLGGTTVSASGARNLFLTSLLAGGVSAYVYGQVRRGVPEPPIDCAIDQHFLV